MTHDMRTNTKSLRDGVDTRNPYAILRSYKKHGGILDGGHVM